jgi:hypothetical protein
MAIAMSSPTRTTAVFSRSFPSALAPTPRAQHSPDQERGDQGDNQSRGTCVDGAYPLLHRTQHRLPGRSGGRTAPSGPRAACPAAGAVLRYGRAAVGAERGVICWGIG